MDNRIDVFGLLSLYNSQRYMSAYYTQNLAVYDHFNKVLGVDTNFVTNLVAMVQGWLMQGSWQTYTNEQLLYGWQSTIAAKANGGDFWAGADFNIETWMTPIFTDK